MNKLRGHLSDGIKPRPEQKQLQGRRLHVKPRCLFHCSVALSWTSMDGERSRGRALQEPQAIFFPDSAKVGGILKPSPLERSQDPRNSSRVG